MPQNPSSVASSGRNGLQCGYNSEAEFREHESPDTGSQEDLSLPLGTWEDIDSFCTKVGLLQPNDQGPDSCQLDSVDLLRSYACGFVKSNVENDRNREDDMDGRPGKLATEGIITMAGQRYIECSSQNIDETCMFMPLYGSSFSGLSVEEIHGVKLVHLLLTAAEKVGDHQYERATRLLAQCECLASDTGNPVQRVVYYLTKALRERIHRKTGRVVTRRISKKDKNVVPAMAMTTNLVFLKFHQEIPFNQVITFAGIQAILEEVEYDTKIHLIDFQIRSGVQWTGFIQALAERVWNPVQHLKITAVGTTERHKMEETGKLLESFAMSMNLQFSYRIIFLPNMNILREEHFITKQREKVVVYCPLILRTMISRPDCLESVMRVIRKLNPSMMVVTEVEANHNSPSFFNRFVEALFFYGAYFDCLEECTEPDNDYRHVLERVFFGDGIKNIIATEGEERICRSVKMNVWRSFFQRFRMEPLELSESSRYQARLHLGRFACASSCTLDSEDKWLTVGWKGTPIQSLSIWKFH